MGTDIACAKLGGIHVVSITCLEIAREVLRKQDANFISRPLSFASETFSGGYRNAVLSPYGDQWKKMRPVLTLRSSSRPATHGSTSPIIIVDNNNWSFA
jgi:tyrosine N-monooxygenase